MFCGVGQFVESETGHTPGIVGAFLQVSEDLTAQFLDLVGRESGMAQCAGENVERQRQVFGQALGANAGGVCTSTDANTGADRFQLFVDLLKGAPGSAAHQSVGSEGGQPGLFWLFVVGPHAQVTADDDRRAAVVLARQHHNSVIKFVPYNVLRSGYGHWYCSPCFTFPR